MRSKRTVSVALALRHRIVVKQAGRRVDNNDPSLNVDGRNERRHERNHDSATIRGNEKQILSRSRGQSTDGSKDITGRSARLETHELMRVPGILLGVSVDKQAGATQSLRILTSGALLKRCEHTILVHANAAHSQAALISRNVQARPGCHHLGIVAAHVHDDLASQTVGGADDSGCELHVFS